MSCALDGLGEDPGFVWPIKTETETAVDRLQLDSDVETFRNHVGTPPHHITVLTVHAVAPFARFSFAASACQKQESVPIPPSTPL